MLQPSDSQAAARRFRYPIVLQSHVRMDDMYDKFAVSDWDLQNENNPRRHKRSKKQALFGT